MPEPTSSTTDASSTLGTTGATTPSVGDPSPEVEGDRSGRTGLWVALVLCVGGFLALGALVLLDVDALDSVDRTIGQPFFDATVANRWLFDAALVVQAAFGTIGLTAMTAVAAVFLWTRNHKRAAGWTVGVMTAVWIAVTVLKLGFDRSRPEWTDPLVELSSKAFPSGHATGVGAGAGVAIVLTTVFVRRRGLRHALVALWLVVGLLVGLDRLFLGVHNASDVVAGWLVGAAIVLAALLVYDPEPQATAVAATPEGQTGVDRAFAVVLNPIKVESVEGFKREVARAAAKGGWDAPRWYETTVADPGASMADQAARDGAELVMVCGGDGTVRAVCSELAGTGIPVGIIPAGTGNLLARNLDLPLFLPSAVDVALHGEDRAVDLVKIAGDGIEGDQHFLVMAGMGLDAQLMDGVNEKIKDKVGWIAYIFSGFKSLMFPAVRLEIVCDGGEPTTHRARTVVIGNVGYLQAGMPLLPDATIDDGKIDVVLINPRRFLSWLRVVWRVLTRAKRTDGVVNRFTCASVVVTASADTPRQLDGDSIGPGRELRAEVMHGRLLVRSPR